MHQRMEVQPVEEEEEEEEIVAVENVYYQCQAQQLEVTYAVASTSRGTSLQHNHGMLGQQRWQHEESSSEEEDVYMHAAAKVSSLSAVVLIKN